METDNIVESIDFCDAEKFFDALSISRSGLWWCPQCPTSWIFRGQRNADWKLKPSAFRPDKWDELEALSGGIFEITQGSNMRNQVHVDLELGAVWAFAKAADRQGLSVPVFDHSWLNSDKPNPETHYYLDDVYSHQKTFPLPEWGPLFGMAQHYGIPTRLLDWTESSYIAAYFAASDAVRAKEEGKKNIGEQIAVWAARTDLFTKYPNQSRGELQIVRAPWASNPNLRAQRGLFTLVHIKLDRLDEVVPEDFCLEEAIKRLIKNDETLPPRPFVRCLRLDEEKSKNLLNLFRKEGITAASVFPGYAGVTQSLKELRWYIALDRDPKKPIWDINKNHKDRQKE